MIDLFLKPHHFPANLFTIFFSQCLTHGFLEAQCWWGCVRERDGASPSSDRNVVLILRDC